MIAQPRAHACDRRNHARLSRVRSHRRGPLTDRKILTNICLPAPPTCEDDLARSITNAKAGLCPRFMELRRHLMVYNKLNRCLGTSASFATVTTRRLPRLPLHDAARLPANIYESLSKALLSNHAEQRIRRSSEYALHLVRGSLQNSLSSNLGCDFVALQPAGSRFRSAESTPSVSSRERPNSKSVRQALN